MFNSKIEGSRLLAGGRLMAIGPDPTPAPSVGGTVRGRGASLPRIPRDLADRPRLNSQIEDGGPLVVVRAPAGSGKTTLIAQWLTSRVDDSAVVAWVSVRRGTESLWDEVAETLDLAGLAVERGGQPAWERVRLALRRDSRSVVLVLDSYDNLGGSADAELLELVRHGANLRVVIGARRRGDVEDIAFAGFDVSKVTSNDLLLTVDEVHELGMRAGLELSSTSIIRLHAQTAGWPGLLRTVVLALADASGGVDHETVSSRLTLRYLRRSVPAFFDDGQNASRLFELAITGTLTFEIAALVVGEEHAATMLDTLEGEGLITSDVLDGETTYQWVPLVRTVLCQELQRRGTDGVRSLHIRLAEWFRARSEPGSALLHADLGGARPLVADIMQESWLQLILSDFEVVESVLSRSPVEEFADLRRIGMLRNMVTAATGTGTVSSFRLPSQVGDLEAYGRSADVRTVLDAGLMYLFAFWKRGNVDEMISLAAKLEIVAGAARTSRPAEAGDLLGTTFFFAGKIRQFVGDLAASSRMLEAAYVLADMSVISHTRCNAGMGLAVNAAVAGEPARAEGWLASANDSPRPHGRNAQFVRAARRITLALVATGRLQQDEAESALKGLTLEIPREVQAFWLYARAQHALLWGEPTAMIQQLEKARLAYDGSSVPSAADWLLPTVEADLFMSMGRGNQAQTVLNAAHAPHPRIAVSRARLALLSGNHEVALSMCAEVRWDPSLTPREGRDLALVQVVAHARAGRRKESVEILEELVHEYRRGAPLCTFALLPRTLLTDLSTDIPGAEDLLDELNRHEIREVFPEHLELIKLTGKEAVVLAQLAGNFDAQHIAAELHVTIATVKSQRNSLYRKLGVGSRDEAVALGRELGLIPVTT